MFRQYNVFNKSIYPKTLNDWFHEKFPYATVSASVTVVDETIKQILSVNIKQRSSVKLLTNYRQGVTYAVLFNEWMNQAFSWEWKVKTIHKFLCPYKSYVSSHSGIQKHMWSHSAGKACHWDGYITQTTNK